MNLRCLVVVAASVVVAGAGCAAVAPAPGFGAMNPAGAPCLQSRYDITIPEARAGASPVLRQQGDHEARKVREGCRPDFRAAFAQGAQPGQVIIVFEDETPFVDATGNPVWTFPVAAGARLRARPHAHGVCTEQTPCKYTILHFVRGQPSVYRPLDPYIIIIM